MSKPPIPVAHEIRPARSKSKLSRIAAIVVVSAVLGPLVAEVATLCYAQWREVMGVSTVAHTPIFDLVGAGLQRVHELFWDHIAPSFQDSFRDLSLALPLAALLIVLAMAMLKR